MKITETDRLTLRHLETDDAPFYFQLLNQPSWIANIGDRNVRSIIDAERNIRNAVFPHYRKHGFGMYLVELKDDGMPLGVCGLLKRETLPAADLGFALLEVHWGKGYAGEAAAAMIDHAFAELHLDRLLAITTQDNHRSGKLLQKLGFTAQGPSRIGTEDLLLYRLAATEQKKKH